jgi:hypothetical protein
MALALAPQAPEPLPTRNSNPKNIGSRRVIPPPSLRWDATGRDLKSTNRLLKNGFFVILGKAKDLDLIDITRFFAALRMTI